MASLTKVSDVLASKDSRKVTLCAVILDVLHSHRDKSKTDEDSCFKLRITDYDMRLGKETGQVDKKRLLKVSIYYDWSFLKRFPEQSPNIRNIGDLIVLEDFNIKLLDGGEISLINDKHSSNWMIYDGRKASLPCPYISSIDITQMHFDKLRLDQEELSPDQTSMYRTESKINQADLSKALNKNRAWVSNYFEQTSRILL